MEVFGSLATIVGLMCNFKSERRAASEDEYKEFIEWLDNKRHKALVNELNSNHLLGLSIKSLLGQNHDVVIKKLSNLDTSLAQLASKISGFKGIVQAIDPVIDLSNQAIDILGQLKNSSCPSIQQVKVGFFDVDWSNNETQSSNTVLEFTDRSGAININEPRFLCDDLNSLCELGLLLPSDDRENDRVYTITRAAISYLEQVEIEL